MCFCRSSSLLFDMFPSVLVCYPEFFVLNLFMKFEQRYTTAAFIQDITTYIAGSVYPSVVPEITLSFWWGSCCLFFSFLCCVMCTIVCLFVLFIFSHGVVSLFSIYEFDCPSDIFRPSSMNILLYLFSKFSIKTGFFDIIVNQEKRFGRIIFLSVDFFFRPCVCRMNQK